MHTYTYTLKVGLMGRRPEELQLLLADCITGIEQSHGVVLTIYSHVETCSYTGKYPATEHVLSVTLTANPHRTSEEDLQSAFEVFRAEAQRLTGNAFIHSWKTQVSL